MYDHLSKRPSPISDHDIQNTNFFPVKALQLQPLENDHTL